jgi:hypothetical protein
MSQLKKAFKKDMVLGVNDVTFEKDKYVVHVKPESKLQVIIL